MRIPWTLGIVFCLSLLGCRGDSTPSSSCSGDNGAMCDVFPSPAVIRQDPVQLHFTGSQVTEGNCQPPQCLTTACTELRFDNAPLFSVTASDGSPPDVLPADARCRFQVSTAEGESLDVVLSLTVPHSLTLCCCQPGYGSCNATQRQWVGYNWSVSVNGVELGTDTVTLPALWDGGIVSIDAASP